MVSLEQFMEKRKRNGGKKSAAAQAAENLTLPERRDLLGRSRAALAGTDSEQVYKRWVFLRNEVRQGRLKPGS